MHRTRRCVLFPSSLTKLAAVVVHSPRRSPESSDLRGVVSEEIRLNVLKRWWLIDHRPYNDVSLLLRLPLWESLYGLPMPQMCLRRRYVLEVRDFTSRRRRPVQNIMRELRLAEPDVPPSRCRIRQRRCQKRDYDLAAFDHYYSVTEYSQQEEGARGSGRVLHEESPGECTH